MINLHDVRHCRVGVGNLDEATRFATDILGLDVAYREPNAVYFKSDERDRTRRAASPTSPSSAADARSNRPLGTVNPR